MELAMVASRPSGLLDLAARALPRALCALTSLKLTIVCFVLLMALVVACTLAQVELGTFGAVNAYIRSFLVWWRLPGTSTAVPVFPGGGLVGLVLTMNLITAQLKRLEMSWRKMGIWVVHAGLIVLFAGEFVTAFFQVETRMAIEQGQTLDFVESPREMEVALVDVTDPRRDQAHSVPESLLARGGVVDVPGTAIALDVKRFIRNAELSVRRSGDPDPIANRGAGTRVAVTSVPSVSNDDQVDRRAVFIEPIAGGRRYGVWLVSNALGTRQQFDHEGRTYELSMRPRREYLPYAITLKKFSHDVYPGTDIPKNFSSLVRLSASGEERDVLIFMNQPLRYAGRTFYQASFGKDDTLSVLQVVKNPGGLLPYVSCVMIALGLIVHFAVSLARALRKQRLPSEAR